jgi:hypothetical protein
VWRSGFGKNENCELYGYISENPENKFYIDIGKSKL